MLIASPEYSPVVKSGPLSREQAERQRAIFISVCGVLVGFRRVPDAACDITYYCGKFVTICEKLNLL